MSCRVVRRDSFVPWFGRLLLHVLDHPHKAIIHVQLMMTVKEGGPRVVRYKIHLDALIGLEVDDILHDAC